MKAPASIGLCRDEKHNYFWDGAGPLPSPTTIVRVLAAGWALENWRIEQRVRIAIRDAHLLAEMRDRGETDAAVKYVMSTKEDRSALDRGSAVHEWAEKFNRGELTDAPPALAAECAGYVEWAQATQPEWLLVEEMVANLEYGYAGTLDGLARIDGENWLLDIKTSKSVEYRGKVNDDYRLQLAAYGNAEFWGRPNDPEQHPMPKVDRYGIVHVTPTGTRLVDAKVTRSDWLAFLQALSLHNWKREAA